MHPLSPPLSLPPPLSIHPSPSIHLTSCSLPSAFLSPLSSSQEEVEQKLLYRKTLGISKLRFLPKSSGARPIINLGSKVKLSLPFPGNMEGQNSVNYQLQDAFHILTYEKAGGPTIHVLAPYLLLTHVHSQKSHNHSTT